jgi:hypothetical protein
MPLTCNIDAKGKAVRLGMGFVVIIVGLLLSIFWALPRGEVWAWIVSLLVFVFGAFQVFEGWAGWCVVRAMGIKTKV